MKIFTLLSICLLIFSLLFAKAEKKNDRKASEVFAFNSDVQISRQKIDVSNKIEIEEPIIAEHTIWQADTIIINQNITILDTVTLTIQSGTNVIFTGRYSIIVEGALKAEGNLNDSIHFFARNKGEGWRGIQFLNDRGFTHTKDSSIISYCSISNINNYNEIRENIYLNKYSKARFSNCYINNNNCRYGVFRCVNESNPLIYANKISNNEGPGIFCHGSSPIILGNYIVKNGYTDPPQNGSGIMLENSNAIIINNIIALNRSTDYGTGITAFYNSNPKILNNNICYNSAIGEYGKAGGILFDGTSYSIVTNCILWGNSGTLDNSQMMFFPGNNNPILFYCVIEGGEDGIVAFPEGSELQYMDEIYQNCFSQSPEFEDALHLNFNLSPNSYCINMGTPDTTGFNIPKFDINENPRIYSERIDIGAIEFQRDPGNKKPELQKISRLDMLTNSRVELEIRYFDPDINDKHSFSIHSNNPNIKIENFRQDLTIPTYEIVHSGNWTGSADITVTINDNSGALNASDAYTYKVNVNENACGNIEGKTTWEKDTINVDCDITISPYAELIIKEGTIIRFLNYTGINVKGKIIAIGTSVNPIQFVAADTLGFDGYSLEIGWKGIDFIENMQDTSILRHCSFKHTSTSDYNIDGVNNNGAALYLDKYKRLVVENCLFRKNKAYGYGGAIYGLSSNLSISNSRFEHNLASHGGAISLFNSKLEMLYDTVYSNIASVDGSALYIRESDLVYKNCMVINNYTNHPNFKSSLNIYGGSCKIYNNIICNNSGGIDFDGCSVDIYNSVIYNNANYAIDVWNCNPVIKNSIIYGHIETAWGSPEIFYSILEYPFHKGENNLILSPFFINPTHGVGHKYDALKADWSIKNNSYAINLGDPTTNFSEFPFDFAKNNRLFGDRIDIGAFELQVPPQNRQPIIYKTQDISVVPLSTTEMTMSYWDPDTIDSHTIEINTNNNNVLIENIINNSTNISFNIKCINNWVGNAVITLKVRDNSNSNNSMNSGSFKVICSNNVCGHILNNTLWEADYVNISCNTIIDDNITLEIKPGVQLNFAESVTLEIIGTLIARGTQKDSIIFTSKNNSSRWAGIMIKNGFHAYGHASGIMNDNDTTQLAFCEVKNISGQGFFIDGYSKVKIEKSHFHEINGTAIHMYESSPILKNNIIEGNFTNSMESGTIWAERYSNPQIINNIIQNNNSVLGGGICCDYYSHAMIIGNLIYNNEATAGGGIYCTQSNPIIYNNTIVENKANQGAGIYGRYSVPQIMNTIIWDNKAENEGNQLYFWSYAPKMSYCFISNAEGDMYFAEQPDMSEFIISIYPEFEQESSIYELSPNSSCINTGSNLVMDEYFPRFDLMGNNRKVDSLDIGAIEFQGQPNDLPPLDFSLSSKFIYENEPIGTTIGSFYVIDPNINELHTYDFIVGDGQNDKNNDDFLIVSDSLKTNKIFDFEEEANKTIYVEVKDSKGHILQKSFSIEVKNLFEEPELIYPLPDLKTYVDTFFYFKIPDSTFFFENDYNKFYRASIIGADTLPQWLNFDLQTGVFSGTPTTEASYKILIYAINWYEVSIPDTISIEVLTNNPTFNNEIEMYDWEIYPNPASEQITVSSSKMISVITIYDTLGKIIYSNDKIYKPEMNLNVAHFPRGVYIVFVNNNKNSKSKKIILK